jgi:hypothetical protein
VNDVEEAIEFLYEYDGDFEFLREMKKCVTDPSYRFTTRQIEAILRCKRRERAPRLDRHDEKLEPGVYRVPRGDDFDIYKVQPNKSKTRVYAKLLKPIGGRRLNHDDEIVQWEWEYAPGAITKIRPEHRMTEEDAKHFGLRYGICAACGKTLKVPESVERGIGPVCMKWFRF